MLIKICGLTTTAETEYLNEDHVDFAGMVLFFPKSKRNISIGEAEQIIAALDPSIKKVAVTVSPTLEQILQIQSLHFDYVQIHGELRGEVLDNIKLPILKAFNVSDMKDYEYYHSLPQIAGYVFDAAVPGSGKTFDWSLIKDIPRDEKLLLLAGGLHAGNVAEAIKHVKPDGVDVSSGVEYDDKPGKDPEKIAEFIKACRS